MQGLWQAVEGSSADARTTSESPETPLVGSCFMPEEDSVALVACAAPTKATLGSYCCWDPQRHDPSTHLHVELLFQHRVLWVTFPLHPAWATGTTHRASPLRAKTIPPPTLLPTGGWRTRRPSAGQGGLPLSLFLKPCYYRSSLQLHQWGGAPPPGISCNNDFFSLWSSEALLYDIKKVNPKRAMDVGSFQVNPDGTQERSKVAEKWYDST